MSKTRFFIAIFVCLLIVGVIFAQDAQTYQLHQPTADEYLSALQAIQAANPRLETIFVNAAALEVDWRYIQPRALNADQLMAFYEVFIEAQVDTYVETANTLRPQWTQTLIELLVADRAINVELQEIHIGDFTVRIMPMDFISPLSGETGAVYRLDVYKGQDNALYVQSFLIHVTDDQYRLVELPLPTLQVDTEAFLEREYWWSIWGFFTTVYSSNSIHKGELIVLAWKDGGIELLARIPFEETPLLQTHPFYNDFTFLNLDSDLEREIQHYKRLGDNWDCEFTRITTYDYDEEQSGYMQSAGGIYFPNDFGCWVRQAEEAMWEHDYRKAIDLYKRAFTVENLSEDELELKPYAQVRLALAYTFTGQNDLAAVTVQRIEVTDNGFVKVFLQTYAINPKPLALCQASYDFASEHWDEVGSTGETEEYDGIFRGIDYYGGFYIENAACDLASLIEQTLAATHLTTDQSPVEQLEALGLKASDYISEDFNLDGQLEWLVWISGGIDPIFFYPDGATYQVSRLLGTSPFHTRVADLRLPDSDNYYDVITLPDGHTRALVHVDKGYDSFAVARCVGCGGGGGRKYCSYEDYDETQRTLGDLSLWHVENGTLTTMFYDEYCGSSDINALFPNGVLELHASMATVDESGFDVMLIPAVYYWDTETMTYQLPPQPTLTPQPTITPYPQEETPLFFKYSLEYLVIQKDFATLVQVTETIPTDRRENVQYQAHYLRALALEALNRDDEALAEYVAIYEAAPESVWGILAALHFEVDSE